MGSVDPILCKHVYKAIVWLVLHMGCCCGTGSMAKDANRILNKTQNVTLRWISGAFKTTPIKWMEFILGVQLVMQKANYMLQNALQRPSRLSAGHVLNRLAEASTAHHSIADHHYQFPRTENICTLKDAITTLPPLQLQDPIMCIGSRLLDCTHHIAITIPAAPPRASKVFAQWVQAWIQESYHSCAGKTIIGSD